MNKLNSVLALVGLAMGMGSLLVAHKLERDKNERLSCEVSKQECLNSATRYHAENNTCEETYQDCLKGVR